MLLLRLGLGSLQRSETCSLCQLCLLFALLTMVTADPDPRRGKGNRNRFGKDLNATGRADENEIVRNHRRAKVFSLFSVVNFRNTGCQSSESLAQGQTPNRNGTCYSTTECSDRSGLASGSCAAGFGVCCVFTLSGGTVTENCTYIQNQGFPTGDTSGNAQAFTIQKCSDDVCFLRLDFETFTTQGPTDTTEADGGACSVDMLTINTPTSQAIPPICGENSGQHIYLDIGANGGDTASIAFAFNQGGTTSTLAREWDIKVTQVECSNPNAPPGGTCLQYQTGLTGRIESFNFNGGSGLHLADQQYSTCIRAADGYCCVSYQVCPDQSAIIATSNAAPGFSLDGKTVDVFADAECITQDQDYIAIPQSSTACNMDTGADVFSRYCGAALSPSKIAGINVAICDCTAPFMVEIRTDDGPEDGAANTKLSTGLCLEYMQIPCA